MCALPAYRGLACIKRGNSKYLCHNKAREIGDELLFKKIAYATERDLGLHLLDKGIKNSSMLYTL